MTAVRVALYARVSTAGQDPDNQIGRLTEFAAARGYEVVGVFSDVASGANPRRPQLNAMLDMAKKRKIDRILATKLDRLARSVINISEMMNDLLDWGVDVELLDQSIAINSSSGRFTVNVLAAVAEFERELIRERTRDGLERARRQGKTLGRPKTKLSAYQKEKARALVSEHPDWSVWRIAKEFNGIGQSTMVKLLVEEGICPDPKVSKAVGAQQTVSEASEVEN